MIIMVYALWLMMSFMLPLRFFTPQAPHQHLLKFSYCLLFFSFRAEGTSMFISGARSRYIFVFNDIIHALVGLQRDVGYDVKSSTKTMMTVVFSHAVKPPFIYMIQPIQKKEN